MAKKRSMNDLLEPVTPDASDEELGANKPLSAPAPVNAPPPTPARRQAKPVTRVDPEAGLERKETKLHPGQRDDLTVLVRRLNRLRRPGQGDRLTENTLIRIGAAWVLEQAGQLAGVTEDELRASVGVSPIVH